MNYSAGFSVVQKVPVSLGSEEELAGPPRKRTLTPMPTVEDVHPFAICARPIGKALGNDRPSYRSRVGGGFSNPQ
jgi:hypothetical protein